LLLETIEQEFDTAAAIVIAALLYPFIDEPVCSSHDDIMIAA